MNKIKMISILCLVLFFQSTTTFAQLLGSQFVEALEKEDSKAAISLIKNYEAPIDTYRYTHGRTILFIATIYFSEEVIKFLLQEKKANPTLTDKFGVTPIEWVLRSSFHALVKERKHKVLDLLLQYTEMTDEIKESLLKELNLLEDRKASGISSRALRKIKELFRKYKVLSCKESFFTPPIQRT